MSSLYVREDEDSDRRSMESWVSSDRSSSIEELRLAEADNHRLQKKLAQWVDVATQLVDVMEHRSNSGDVPRRTRFRRTTSRPFRKRNKENEENAIDASSYLDGEQRVEEDLGTKFDRLSKRSARQSADLKFARQKETSMRNALYEKSKQIESMGLESQRLVEQLNNIEGSFKNQQAEYDKLLENKKEESRRWERMCLQLQQELEKVQESFSRKSHESAQSEEDLQKALEQNRQGTKLIAQQNQQISALERTTRSLTSELDVTKIDSVSKIERLEEEKDKKDRAIGDLKSMVVQLESQCAQSNLRVRSIEEKLKQYDELVDFQRARISEMEGDQSKREMENETLKRDMEEERSRASNLQEEIHKHQEELERERSRTDESMERLRDCEARYQADRSKEAELRKQIDRLEKDLTESTLIATEIKESKLREQGLEQKLEERIRENDRLRGSVATIERERLVWQQQIEELERRISESVQREESCDSTSPVIASMRRLQGLLHARERDLRKSQLRIVELEGRLNTANDRDVSSDCTTVD